MIPADMRSFLRHADVSRAVPRLTGERRRCWVRRLDESCREYWPDLGSNVSVTLARRALARSGGHVLCGTITDGRVDRSFCIKWCPAADPTAMEQTLVRVKWWRRHHPELSKEVVDVLAFWPDEMVLLMERRSGRCLGRYLGNGLARSVKPASELDIYGARLGEWLRSFAEGNRIYGAEIQPMLGLHACRRDDGRLVVDARRLLEQRIERGEQAASVLRSRGRSPMRSWADRFDVDAIVTSFGDEEPAGFIHGDVKPDNVLTHEGGLMLIDWWTTPRVSWPLTDVATFAGNLWLYGENPAADRLWRRFVQAYYPGGLDERTRQAVELVGTIMCLMVLADESQRPLFHRLTVSHLRKRSADQLISTSGPIASV